MSFRLAGDGRAVADFGPGRLDVVGGLGLRLTETTFHLDEGPELLWVNPYRLLARGRLLGYARTRPVDAFSVEDGDAIAAWEPNDEHPVRLRVSTSIVDDATVDTTFSVVAVEAVEDYEVFVSSYFTPNQTPWFWVRRSPFVADDPVWVTKTGAEEYEPTSWPRDEVGGAQLADGRWNDGQPPVWWYPGSYYQAPLTMQVHRWVPLTVVMMCRAADCVGISGLAGYHNSQYFHLFGRTLDAGDAASATVRTVIDRTADESGLAGLQARAAAAYETFASVDEPSP